MATALSLIMAPAFRLNIALWHPAFANDKTVSTHLHGDHTSDIITLYCFGRHRTQNAPEMYMGLPFQACPTPPQAQSWMMDEGILQHSQTAHVLARTELQIPTDRLRAGNEGYDIVAHELPWQTVGGTAYENNGVKITHFPAAHTRNGSISYRLTGMVYRWYSLATPSLTITWSVWQKEWMC